jgi:phage-related baseplate assembly protein
MPNYESPALYIDFSRLPPPKVIEEVDFEVLLQRYKDQVVAKNANLARAIELEQSPVNVILEPQAYGEMIVRSRINAAARAVMLAFATGYDLDNLAAFFGVERGIVPGNPNVTPVIPDSPETDTSLRRRAQLAPEAMTTAGSEGAYIFQAISADLSIRDASAVAVDRNGTVKVSIMRSGSDPVPTASQLANVVARLNKPDIKPLTDVVIVSPAKVIYTDINAELTLYPGPDQALVMADVQAGLTKVRDRVSLLGRDLTRSSIISALNQEGVQSVNLKTPSENIIADVTQCVVIKSASVTVLPTRVE